MKITKKWYSRQRVLLFVGAVLAAGCMLGSCNLPADKGTHSGNSGDTSITASMPTMVAIAAAPNVKIGEKRDREVSLSAYSIAATEVTQALYKAVMGANPSKFCTEPAKGEVQEQRPVECVSWYDAVSFCNELTRKTMSEADCVYTITEVRKEKKTNPDRETIISAQVSADFTKKGYRLPTQAEWEWAFLSGNSETVVNKELLNKSAWWRDNAGNKTHQVSKKDPTPSGLYDMLGNVGEWCEDYGNGEPWKNNKEDPVQTVPAGILFQNDRVVKGGYYGEDGRSCNPYFQGCSGQSTSDELTGFRFVRRP